MPYGFAFVLLLALAIWPARAAEPTAADVDRLLDVMQVESQMDQLMRQMEQAQVQMIRGTLDKGVSESQEAAMQRLIARSQERTRQRMSWTALAPVVRRVYAEMYTREEVGAMIAFYGSPTGASILRKTPQVSARMMELVQPVMSDMVIELKDSVDAELAKPEG